MLCCKTFVTLFEIGKLKRCEFKHLNTTKHNKCLRYFRFRTPNATVTNKTNFVYNQDWSAILYMILTYTHETHVLCFLRRIVCLQPLKVVFSTISSKALSACYLQKQIVARSAHIIGRLKKFNLMRKAFSCAFVHWISFVSRLAQK